MNPLVSVVMPAYNAEKFVGEAITSILNQTYSNLELIIVEDCSIDNTLKEIEKFHDERIKLLRNPVNKGIAYSTNRGIEVSRGKYVALMDDDDISEPDRIKLQVAVLEERQSIDILGGRYCEINENGDILQYHNIPRNNPKYIKVMLLFRFMDFANSSVMMRKDFLLNNHLKYSENCYGMQDFKLYIESSKIGNISSVEQLVLRHRIHEHNETKRVRRENGEKRAETFAAFQKYSLEKSGFRLDKEEIALFTRVFAETGVCKSLDEWKLVYDLFQKMLIQAKKMQVDYLEELKHYLRAKLAEKYCTFDVFSEI